MYLQVVCWKTIDDGKKRTTTAGDLNYHADVQVQWVAQHPMSHIQRVSIEVEVARCHYWASIHIISIAPSGWSWLLIFNKTY